MKKILYILLFFSCSLFGQHQTMLLVSKQQFANETSTDSIQSFNWESYNTATDQWTFQDPDSRDLNSGTTNAYFNNITGNTPTGGRGPSDGVITGERYCYTEGSGSSNNDIWSTTYDNTIDASTYNIEFKFYTNQRGDDNNVTCEFQTNENSAGWVTRFTCGGASDPTKVASDGTDVWVLRTVDLTGVVSHSSTQIRLLITFPSSGSTSHFDYGIDDFTITLN